MWDSKNTYTGSFGCSKFSRKCKGQEKLPEADSVFFNFLALAGPIPFSKARVLFQSSFEVRSWLDAFIIKSLSAVKWSHPSLLQKSSTEFTFWATFLVASTACSLFERQLFLLGWQIFLHVSRLFGLFDLGHCGWKCLNDRKAVHSIFTLGFFDMINPFNKKSCSDKDLIKIFYQDFGKNQESICILIVSLTKQALW